MEQDLIAIGPIFSDDGLTALIAAFEEAGPCALRRLLRTQRQLARLGHAVRNRARDVATATSHARRGYLPRRRLRKSIVLGQPSLVASRFDCPASAFLPVAGSSWARRNP